MKPQRGGTRVPEHARGAQETTRAAEDVRAGVGSTTGGALEPLAGPKDAA